jgi:hypothetical protein
MISAKSTGIAKVDVTAVTAVQASVYAGFGCNVTNAAAVTGVTASEKKSATVTAVTAQESMPLQRKPNAHAACTPVTSVTSHLNNVQCNCSGLKSGGV